MTYVTHGFKNFATRAKLKRWLYHARRIMLISLLTVYRVAPSTKRLAISNIKQVGIKKKVDSDFEKPKNLVNWGVLSRPPLS